MIMRSKPYYVPFVFLVRQEGEQSVWSVTYCILEVPIIDRCRVCSPATVPRRVDMRRPG